MRYTKNKLKIELLKVFSTEKDRHKNRYNVLGRGLPESPGALEYQMQTTFTADERALAGQAINELESRGLIVPTYKDINSPGDWLIISSLGKRALETGALDELDNLLLEIKSGSSLVSMRYGAYEAIISKHTDWPRHAASSCRELITKVLHAIAPDEEVRKDTAFIPNKTSKNEITRKERIRHYLRNNSNISKRNVEVIDKACNLLEACYKKLSAVSHTDIKEVEYLVKLTEDSLFFLLN